MSKRIDPPKIGEVYQDRSYAPGDRLVRIVEETTDWRGRPAFIVEVVQHMFPSVVGRKTTVSAAGIRTKYRREPASVTVDTTELRARSKIIDPGLPLTAKAMTEAADELDTLRRALAAVPHAELCRLLMTRDGEPCSCEKSAAPQFVVTGTATVRHPDVTRLEVHGPAGRVVGLLALTGALVDLQDDGRTLKVIYEQKGS